MSHPHHHGSMKDYFTEQLLTIGVCLLFGFVAVQLYLQNKLAKLLVPEFFPWVLAGGIAIIVMVVLRGIAIWKEAGEYQAQMQSAAAGGVDCQDCNHVHIPGQEEHDHDHPHGHDLSWMFARMLIMFFPVGLFFLGLPDPNLAAQYVPKGINDMALNAETLKDMAADKETTVLEEKYENGLTHRILKTKTGLKLRETKLANGEFKLEILGGEMIAVRFNELNNAIYDAGSRERYQGKTAVLEGHFNRLGDKEFTLYRFKMTCCQADAVPLKVRIVAPQAVSGFKNGQWVRVKGQVQFLELPGQNITIPVLVLAEARDVEAKTAPMNESE